MPAPLPVETALHSVAFSPMVNVQVPPIYTIEPLIVVEILSPSRMTPLSVVLPLLTFTILVLPTEEVLLMVAYGFLRPPS